jgi:limonene-1,2-epoxide hydrolase
MDKKQLEWDNEALVAKLIAAWEAKDLDGIKSTLHDDVVYQMFEGADDIVGVDEVCAVFKPIIEGPGTIEWDLLRSHAVGSLVMNERVDKFLGISDGKGGTRDMQAPVAGVFYLRDGKIAEWRDYTIPGSQAHS